PRAVSGRPGARLPYGRRSRQALRRGVGGRRPGAARGAPGDGGEPVQNSGLWRASPSVAAVRVLCALPLGGEHPRGGGVGRRCAGGLGQGHEVAMSLFQENQLMTLLLAIYLIVTLVDALSAHLRARLL